MTCVRAPTGPSRAQAACTSWSSFPSCGRLCAPGTRTIPDRDHRVRRPPERPTRSRSTATALSAHMQFGRRLRPLGLLAPATSRRGAGKRSPPCKTPHPDASRVRLSCPRRLAPRLRPCGLPRPSRWPCWRWPAPHRHRVSAPGHSWLTQGRQHRWANIGPRAAAVPHVSAGRASVACCYAAGGRGTPAAPSLLVASPARSLPQYAVLHGPGAAPGPGPPTP